MPVQTHTRTTHSYMHPTRGRSVDTLTDTANYP